MNSERKPVLKIEMPWIVEFYDKHHRNMILIPCIISMLCKFWIMQMKLRETPYTISELMSIFEYGKIGKVIVVLRGCDNCVREVYADKCHHGIDSYEIENFNLIKLFLESFEYLFKECNIYDDRTATGTESFEVQLHGFNTDD